MDAERRPFTPPAPNPPPIPPWQFSNCQLEDQNCHENADIAIFCGVFLLALLVPPVLAKVKFQNAEVVTETGGLMLLGVSCGLLWWRVKGEHAHVARSAFVHDVIYYMLLPPIIFEAGFTMRKRKFFANFGMILLYAVVGTLVAILAAGALLFALVQAGAIETQFTFNQLMLFASLISSTDPISTLATLKAVKAKPPLEDLIFGESALNDALSIVFFNVFRALCRQEALAGEEQPPYPPNAPAFPPPPPAQDPPQQVLTMGRMLLIILPCSLFLGVFFGLLCAAITRHSGLRASKKPHAELAVLLVCALAAYAFTDYISLGGAQLSAILASFFSGITMRHYAFYNLSRSAQQASVVMFRTLSSICEVSLALLLGIATVDYLDRRNAWDGAFVGYALLATLLARALNIFPLSELANCRRATADRVTLPMQLVMWFSGMRGAVSFALAMTLEDTRNIHDMISVKYASRIVTATLAAIMFTNFAMAPFTGPLIGALRLGADDAPPPRARSSCRRSSASARRSALKPAEPASGSLPLLQPLPAAPSLPPLGVFSLDSSGSLDGAPPQPAPDSGAECAINGGHGRSCGGHAAQAAALEGAALEGEGPQLLLEEMGAVESMDGMLLDSHTALPIFRSNVHRRWRKFDDKYLKPIFGGQGAAAEEESGDESDN